MSSAKCSSFRLGLNVIMNHPTMTSRCLCCVLQGLLFLLYEPNFDDMLIDYIKPETFTADIQAAMNGALDRQDGFDASNAVCVDRYYMELAQERGLQSDTATSLRESVPTSSELYRTADEMLDQERKSFSLGLVDNPPGPLYHGHYHSQQRHALTKSTTFHGLLYHPGLTESPMTCDTMAAVSPVVHLPTLQRAQTVVFPGATSNGSWCIGIKGEMSGTVCVTFTWDIYIYMSCL